METRVWNVVDHLRTEEDIAAYLQAALEDGDPMLLAAAQADAQRAKRLLEQRKS
jgi:DNA-binding phage protein